MPLSSSALLSEFTRNEAVAVIADRTVYYPEYRQRNSLTFPRMNANLRPNFYHYSPLIRILHHSAVLMYID